MIYGWREREEVLRFFQKVTGLRMNHNFIRPGGVAADLPAGWRDDVLHLLEMIPPRLEEYDILMTGQPIWRDRLQGVGVITAQEAIALGATGPILRSTGVPWDLRRDQPYLHYDELEFDVIVGTLRRRVRPLRHPAQRDPREHEASCTRSSTACPRGDYRIQNKKVTPPPRARIDESMEALIHHFKIFTEGFKVPEGEVYVAIESPRGEIGCYIASDGSATPYRMHVRAPSFVNIQCLPHMMRGGLVADAVAVISSRRPRARRGGPMSMSRLNEAQRRSWPRRSSGATRRRARPPSRCCTSSQQQNGYVTNDAIAHIAELVGATVGRGARHRHVLRDVQVRAGRQVPASTSAARCRASCWAPTS